MRLLLALLILLALPPDPLPPAARVDGLRFEFQTWCNCGPVNLTMVLSYYGWRDDQQTAAAWLKPSIEDKNVSPWELVAFVQHQQQLPDLRALWRYGGDLSTIKVLIAAGFPVIVESGFQPEGHEWMGHYITVVAYDDSTETIWTYDSYNGIGTGAGETTSYTDFDTWWRHFNRLMVIVYPLDREPDVLRLLGALADPGSAAQRALDTARREIETDPRDAWAYFNAGTSAVAGADYASAARDYDTALRLGLPFRMLWYQFGPYAAYYYTGRYYDVLALADETEAITAEVEETNYWRGLALAALGYTDEALAQFDTAIRFNPTAPAPREARDQLIAGTLIAPAPLRILDMPIP